MLVCADTYQSGGERNHLINITAGVYCIRDVLHDLRRPCAYVSCVEFTKPRLMLQSILSQLKACPQEPAPLRNRA